MSAGRGADSSYSDAEAVAAIEAAGIAMQVVPASGYAATGDTQYLVTMFNDTTGEPDRCVIVTVLSESTVALIEYKRLGNAWVFDPADCAYDGTITLNFTASGQQKVTAFAIDNPVSTGDRVVFISGNNDDTTDTFEMDSIVLTAASSTLSAVAVVIAGANQPTDANNFASIGIPLSITRVMTFHQDDAHFATLTESTGTYTFTYTDSTVEAVDTSINVALNDARGYNGIVIGAQVLLFRSGSAGGVPNNRMWEMTAGAVLTEEFLESRVGLQGANAASAATNPVAVSALAGSFAAASPIAPGDGLNAGYIISTFPLDSI